MYIESENRCKTIWCIWIYLINYKDKYSNNIIKNEKSINMLFKYNIFFIHIFKFVFIYNNLKLLK